MQSLVFPFTNENLQSYSQIYTFDGAKVLSVVGSGDQYFTSILNGAKEVDLFDINPIAWKYFVLKFYAIQRLSYEEFWKHFVFRAHNLRKNKHLVRKVSSTMPEDILNFWKTEFSKNKESLARNYTMWTSRHQELMIERNYKNGSFIPYMDEKNYYKLQELLRKRKLPNFFLTHILNIEKYCGNSSYDLIIASNILSWLLADELRPEDEKNKLNEYLKVMGNLRFDQMQANYLWRIDSAQYPYYSEIYLKSELEPTFVPSVTGGDVKDCVLSLKKR